MGHPIINHEKNLCLTQSSVSDT